MKVLMIALIAGLLVLTACAKQQVEAPVTAVSPQPTLETTDDTVKEVETSVAEIGSIDEELDTSELDELEAELAALEGLE